MTGVQTCALPILQPLVENCLKHGLSRKVGGGTITIRAKRRDGVAVLEVVDDGLGMSEERLVGAFRAFAERVVPDGTLFVCADSPQAAAIGAERRAAGMRVERYSIDAEAEWRAVQWRGNDRGGIDFTVLLEGTELGRISLQMPGRHNVLNALGALAMAMRAGVDFRRAAQAAEECTGAVRRFEHVADVSTGADTPPITLMDDYAHHPTEVRATLLAARARFPGRRLVGCFQPHTYSRSR